MLFFNITAWVPRCKYVGLYCILTKHTKFVNKVVIKLRNVSIFRYVSQADNYRSFPRKKIVPLFAIVFFLSFMLRLPYTCSVMDYFYLKIHVLILSVFCFESKQRPLQSLVWTYDMCMVVLRLRRILLYNCLMEKASGLQSTCRYSCLLLSNSKRYIYHNVAKFH